MHIVESDSDKADADGDIKKAIGEKIRGKLVKKVLNSDSESSESSGDSDDANSRIKNA